MLVACASDPVSYIVFLDNQRPTPVIVKVVVERTDQPVLTDEFVVPSAAKTLRQEGIDESVSSVNVSVFYASCAPVGTAAVPANRSLVSISSAGVAIASGDTSTFDSTLATRLTGPPC